MTATKRSWDGAIPIDKLPEPVLRLAGIAKAYGATRALNGIELDLRAGEILALMGANGAGKSTLVKILCGLVEADAGTIDIAGRPVAIASPDDARAAGIVAVHQSIAEVGVPGLTVAENLVLDILCSGRAPVLATNAVLCRLAHERATRIGLRIDLGARLSAVSLAEQQLVAIARALGDKPRVLLLDEPTASLSASEAERLFAVLDGLKRDGVAIVYISHKTSDLRRLADRTLVLRDGGIAAAFERPVDYDAAIRLMVGHDVLARRRAAVDNEATIVLSLRGARLSRSDRAFDFAVRRGEVVAVTGPVGAGKSTLAGALFGLWPLAEGGMELDGAAWQPTSPARSIAAGVFLAGEDRWKTSFFPASVPFATIAGTIGFPFLKRWSPFGLVAERRERDAAAAAIDAFGIKARAPRDPLTALSGGNQQKVVLARWHAEPCRLLLLDEPFQGVDVGARNDIIAAIRQRAADRATIVFVNDYEEALEVGDRILVMENGVVRTDASSPLVPSPSVVPVGVQP